MRVGEIYILYSWPRGNQRSIKANYLYGLTSPLGQKFHADSKMVSKSSNDIRKAFLIEVSREMTMHSFKIEWGKLA
jgi:hypothetical protein